MKLFNPQQILLLVITFSLGLLIGCSNNPKESATTETEKKTTPAIDNPQDETAAAEVKDDTTELAQDTTETQTEAVGEVEPLEKTDPKPVVSSTASGLAAREVEQKRMSIVLDNIAAELEDQELAYISSKGQDCSGIYHKIKNLIQKRIKVLGDQSKYTYPTYAEDRNTRQIANWYHRHNNLYIVQDAMADRNKIRPGSVMFFARTEEKFQSPGIATLTNADVFMHDKAAGKGKIYHIGVVTNVTKDENGDVVRYTLMHGRNSKHNASRTDGNYDGPGGYGKAFAKFPFGNWNQQWVAVANIETPVN